MPKKTKKEKIIAEYRRKMTMVSPRPESEILVKEHAPQTATPTNTPTYIIGNTSTKNEHTDSLTLDLQEFLAVKKDLMMTLALTACILVAQIIIWRVIG